MGIRNRRIQLNVYRDGQRRRNERAAIARTALIASTAFLFVLAAPVTLPVSLDDLAITAFKTAAAGNHGGGKGGGGGPGGGGNANGGNKGGNNNGSTSTSGSNGGSDRSSADAGPPTVILAVFTTTIRKRRPADKLQVLDNPHQAVSFFTELGAMAGVTVKHEWYFRGTLEYTASFDVLADRWRVWSTQLLPPAKTGQWTVKLVTDDGTLLDTKKLNYQPVG